MLGGDKLNDSLKVSGEWDFIYEDGTVITKKNLITQAGLNLLASLLINAQTNDIPFYLGIGTGASAAVSTDTKLQAEGFRKIASSLTTQGSMARIRTFLLSSEANGNWWEFGIFVAGTNLSDSGTLLNHLVTPISKASNQALTIECRITFNAG